VRRQLIQVFLPLVFAILPALGALLVVVSLPRDARGFYASKALGIPTDYSQRTGQAPTVNFLDYFIIGLGCALFLIQTFLAYRAMCWRGKGFDERADPWLNRLAQSSEWFPLLGLIGTVAAILQTFSSIEGPTPQAEIIRKYAPALTATGSGLFMALLNILPAWMSLVGRGLILTLAGEQKTTEGEE
jgi:hypothetical protein